jgi:hypothetical protein
MLSIPMDEVHVHHRRLFVGSGAVPQMHVEFPLGEKWEALIQSSLDIERRIFVNDQQAVITPVTLG